MAIFDVMHIAYFAGANGDISTKFWFLARLTESILINILVTNRIKSDNKHKFLSTILLTSLTAITSFLLIRYSHLLPDVMAGYSMKPLKIIIEYAIAAVNVINLIIVSRSVDNVDIITNKYIFSALMFAIPSGIMFTIYSNINSSYLIIGHLLRIVYSLFIFRGIFVSSVTYPYRKLYEKDKYMDAVFNQLPAGIIKLDEKGVICLVNTRARNIFKCDEDELIGLTIDEFRTKMSARDYMDMTGNKITDLSYYTEAIITYNNMHGEEVKVSSKRIDEAGGCLYLINEIRAEQEISNLQLQTRIILDSVSNAILMYDNNDKIVLCNKMFLQLTGLGSNEVIGMKFDYFKDKYLLPLIATDHDDIKTATDQMEIIIVTPDNGRRNLMYHLMPVNDMDGNKIGTILVASDITQLKEQQRVIMHQEKLAMIGQMGASIVHETKNFLTTIKGGSQLLSLIAEDAQVKKIAKKIDDATDDVNRIISDFLLMAKPRDTVRHPVSIKRLVESTISMLESSSFLNDVEIRLLLSEQEKMVLCNESQIKQVIFNIAKNGVEAMAETDHPLLQICTLMDSENRSMVIEVIDNGKGIPKEIIQKIATPFFTTKQNGTGLGLAVCYRIIKEHGGTIDIDSKVGSGTVFRISLPYIEE